MNERAHRPGPDMRTILINEGNTCYRLVADELLPAKERAVVAELSLWEGLGAWMLTDIRLKEHAVASPFLGVRADDVMAHRVAQSAQELSFIRSQLKEWMPDPANPDFGTIWCTYDSLGRGMRPSEMGLAKHFQHDWALLMKRSEGLGRLRAIADFWSEQPFTERDPELRRKIASTKANNAWRQPSESKVGWEWSLLQLSQLAQGEVESSSSSMASASVRKPAP